MCGWMGEWVRERERNKGVKERKRANWHTLDMQKESALTKLARKKETEVGRERERKRGREKERERERG